MTLLRQFIFRIGEPFLAFALALATLLGAGCASSTTTAPNQRVFATPDEAARALLAALHDNDDAQLAAIFGPDSAELLHSGDPVDDQRHREVIVAAAGQRWGVIDKGPKEKELVIGNDNWLFPVPLVQAGSGWQWDTEAGTREVRARRIRRNELAVIALCRTYVNAQRDYAAEGHDGRPAGTYAERFTSDPGTHNGLYWPSSPGERPSPLDEATATATVDFHDNVDHPSLKPYHGYFFRILTAQGPDSLGGATSYFHDGVMNGGFALLAYPARYGSSGIMTFMVNQDGVVVQADLGRDTAATTGAISAYNPGPGWRPTR